MSDLESQIIDSLRMVYDPEIPVNLYDLGLIYELAVNDDGTVDVTMTLTTPNCPVADALPRQVREAVERVEGVSGATVNLVWEPRWTGEMMTENAKMQLEMMGIEWSNPKLAGPRPTGLTIGKTTPHDEGRG
jgi:FeS assembly SUF system protein